MSYPQFSSERFPKRQYQDIWVKGNVVYEGYRDCELRYEYLKAIAEDEDLEKPRHIYRPTPKILDFGANFGYFSLRLTNDFPGVKAYAVEDYPIIGEIIDANETDDVIWVPEKIKTPARLFELHFIAGPFDLTLVLSVLHQLVNWREMIDAFLEVTRGVALIEPPHPKERTKNEAKDAAQIEPWLRELGGVPIGTGGTVWGGTNADEHRTIFLLKGRHRG